MCSILTFTVGVWKPDCDDQDLEEIDPQIKHVCWSLLDYFWRKKITVIHCHKMSLTSLNFNFRIIFVQMTWFDTIVNVVRKNWQNLSLSDGICTRTQKNSNFHKSLGNTIFHIFKLEILEKENQTTFSAKCHRQLWLFGIKILICFSFFFWQNGFLIRSSDTRTNLLDANLGTRGKIRKVLGRVKAPRTSMKCVAERESTFTVRNLNRW